MTNEAFRKGCIPPAKLHVSLAMLQCKSQVDIDKAVRALKRVGQSVTGPSIHAKFKGIGTFRDQVSSCPQEGRITTSRCCSSC